MKTWLAFVRPRALLVELTGISIVAAALSIALPWPMKWMIDQLTKSPPPDSSRLTLLIALAAFSYLGLSAARGFCFSRRRKLTYGVAENFGRLLSHSVFHKVTSASPAALRSLGRGDAVMTLVEDIEQLKQALVEIAEGCSVELLILCGAAVALFRVDARFATLLLGAMIPLAWTYSSSLPALRDEHRKLRSLDGERHHFAREVTQNLSVVKACGEERAESRAFSLLLRRRARERRSLSRREAAFFFRTESLGAVAATLAIGYGGWKVSTKALTLGECLLFFQYTALLQGPLARLTHLTSIVEKARASGQRVSELLALSPEPTRGKQLARRTPATLQFQSVTFAYPGGPPLLRALDLELSAGERVAIVGASGSGKTTLLNLLLRFESPLEGRIRVDGTDLADLPPAKWRSQVAVVPQEPSLFSRTVRENLWYGVEGQPCPRGRLRETGLEQLVETLPRGLETRLGASDRAFSTGEKQRLVLTRALLRDAPVLLLDEPTASVDRDNEDAITEILRRQLEQQSERITLFITHRPSLLSLATRILELRDGKLVERGSETRKEQKWASVFPFPRT